MQFHLMLAVYLFFKHRWKLLVGLLALVVVLMGVTLAIGKIYQHLDRDPDRGAIAMPDGAMGENFATPIYLDQGWNVADTLWYYNTTQGSALIPYDFFIALEQVDSETLFRDNRHLDLFRYLPQKPTFFNPDGLPVGFTKEYYRKMNYVGFTCAACHTGQVNYQGQAIRIDGAPAKADMVSFLLALEKAMVQTRSDAAKRNRFIERVLALRHDFVDAAQVGEALLHWTTKIELYNRINHSELDYGYARLDAFGRIYNRVLQYVLDKGQLRGILLELLNDNDQPLLTTAQVDHALDAINDTIIGDDEFLLIVERLMSSAPGAPALDEQSMYLIRDALFNEPNAPVSYPFLWDITHSDYVQWNGLAGNAAVGPLGRNAGEVIGVFSILDWSAQPPGFSLSAFLTGQRKKLKHIDFTSSIDLINLQRLEAQLKSLTSPVWPEDVLGEIDRSKAARGKRIYAKYCQACHELIERDAWDRMVIAKMSDINRVDTDPTMAENSVNYTGRSGNFKYTWQDTGVGPLVLEETAPVIQILTSVTTGVVSSADPDKYWFRRWLDWLYTLGLSFFENDVKYSVKAGQYRPDTTTRPYDSLLAYKARSLNGIWATAPYLHNGSVPTLHDLLLPAKRAGDPENGEYRPEQFLVGSREFDPQKVGFKNAGYQGFIFRTDLKGNFNNGHEYAAGRTPQPDGTVLPALDPTQRDELLEFLKTL
jgi:hypothetical protein